MGEFLNIPYSPERRGLLKVLGGLILAPKYLLPKYLLTQHTRSVENKRFARPTPYSIVVKETVVIGPNNKLTWSSENVRPEDVKIDPILSECFLEESFPAKEKPYISHVDPKTVAIGKNPEETVFKIFGRFPASFEIWFEGGKSTLQNKVEVIPQKEEYPFQGGSILAKFDPKYWFGFGEPGSLIVHNPINMSTAQVDFAIYPFVEKSEPEKKVGVGETLTLYGKFPSEPPPNVFGEIDKTRAVYLTVVAEDNRNDVLYSWFCPSVLEWNPDYVSLAVESSPDSEQNLAGVSGVGYFQIREQQAVYEYQRESTVVRTAIYYYSYPHQILLS